MENMGYMNQGLFPGTLDELGTTTLVELAKSPTIYRNFSDKEIVA
jgi:hypothetical protein